MRNRVAITLLLILTSCGSAKASTTEQSVPDEAPQVTKSASTEMPTEAPTTGAQQFKDVQAAFPARLALTTKDGQVVTFAPHTPPVRIEAVVSPSGDVAVSADVADGATTVEWHDLATDAVIASVHLDGELRPTAVATDGQLVALVSSGAGTTTVVAATPARGELRRWTFDAVVVPEAFTNAYVSAGDGLPIGIFVIEYLAENTYRVRVIDTASGELGLPLNLRDKSQTVDEVMTAVSRTAVFEPTHQLLFTLYQDATEGGDDLGAFIHTLGLINGVWCLDVPPTLGLADHPGALAVSPDGQRLYAASSIGGVAVYLIDDITSGDPMDMPLARATASVGQSGQSAGHVAVGATNDEVVVALGGSIFRLDPVTLEVRDSFVWDMDVEALTILADRSILIVGTGRMTLVPPDHQHLLAERTDLGQIGEVTRVAVVG